MITQTQQFVNNKAECIILLNCYYCRFEQAFAIFCYIIWKKLKVIKNTHVAIVNVKNGLICLIRSTSETFHLKKLFYQFITSYFKLVCMKVLVVFFTVMLLEYAISHLYRCSLVPFFRKFDACFHRYSERLHSGKVPK